jgi:hypothetical protein
LVLGGGVAGLTAADELSRRGYEVDVFDADAGGPGGKARSVAPRWIGPSHRNLLDTLGGIPTGAPGETVADRMTTSPEVTLWPGRRTLRWSDLTATRIGQLDHAVEALLNGGASPSRPLPFGASDVAYLTHLLGVVALADRHKLLELEGHGFADYTCRVFAERSVLQPSARLQAWLAGAGTRLLGLPRPAETSARTGLVALLRLLNPMELYTERGERVLPGATHDEWLRLWEVDLGRVSSRRPCAVRFHAGRRVARIELRGDRAVAVVDAAGAADAGFDHLVCALPHASLQAALGDDLPPQLLGLDQLADGWLAGVRFRLREPVDMPEGHNLHLDSPWVLASAPGGPAELAVSVADWDVVSPTIGRKARECTRAEVVAEVWRQLRIDGVVEDAVVDTNVSFGPGGATNSAPVFRNTVGSWAHRPAADPGFENLFLAGDYVRTNADIPTMEAANESARRAVRALLEADRYAGPSVKISSVDHLGLLEDA